MNASTSRPRRLGIEKLIPHVGHIFGLEEEATAIILFELGLLNVKPSVGTVINKKGWEELKATFKVPRNVLDTEKTRIGAIDRPRPVTWFVMFG